MHNCTMRDTCVCMCDVALSHSTRMPFEPIHHNETMHYAYKVRWVEERCRNVRVCLDCCRFVCAGAYSTVLLAVCHPLSFRFDRHRFVLETNTTTPTTTRYAPAERTPSRHSPVRRTKCKRNSPNNNFNNIVCLILRLASSSSVAKAYTIAIILRPRCSAHGRRSILESSTEWLFYEYFTNRIMFLCDDTCASAKCAHETPNADDFNSSVSRLPSPRVSLMFDCLDSCGACPCNNLAFSKSLAIVAADRSLGNEIERHNYTKTARADQCRPDTSSMTENRLIAF